MTLKTNKTYIAAIASFSLVHPLTKTLLSSPYLEHIVIHSHFAQHKRNDLKSKPSKQLHRILRTPYSLIKVRRSS